MAFLQGLFGGEGPPPKERAAIEQDLAVADPLLRQLESEYRQWLERVGVAGGTDVSGINDPQGEHSGMVVWRTIETERTVAQLDPPRRALPMHKTYVACVEARYRAAAALYDALQVPDARPPQAALREATRILAEADGLRRKGDRQRAELERLLG